MRSMMRKLSSAQLYALDLACRYKLRRSSLGWWAYDRGADIEALGYLKPVSVRSLWRAGLLDGNPDPTPPTTGRPSLWANEIGRALRAQIARDVDWWSPTVLH
jgi:hypothetical protein